MVLTRENGSIITIWYQKPTFSGRMLYFNSAHSLTQKRAMVFNLVYRAVALSPAKFHLENLDLVRSLLRISDYPEPFFGGLILKRLYVLSKEVKG